MQTPPLPNTTIAEFYRFALLLTGSVKRAEEIMAETLAEGAPQIAQIRNETGRHAWFVQRIREHCLKNSESAPRSGPPDATPDAKLRPLRIEAFFLAQRFHTLPEPERTALALFYLDFFTVAEIAELLKMNTETLSETLAAARALLRQSLRAAEADPTSR